MINTCHRCQVQPNTERQNLTQNEKKTFCSPSHSHFTSTKKQHKNKKTVNDSVEGQAKQIYSWSNRFCRCTRCAQSAQRPRMSVPMPIHCIQTHVPRHGSSTHLMHPYCIHRIYSFRNLCHGSTIVKFCTEFDVIKRHYTPSNELDFSVFCSIVFRPSKFPIEILWICDPTKRRKEKRKEDKSLRRSKR